MHTLSDNICFEPAHELVNRFRSRDLSPVDVMKALFRQIERYETDINCAPFLFPEEAMRQARLAEKAYMEGQARPLEGLAVAIKDEIYVEGQPTTNGALHLKEQIATSTDPVPERVLAAGGIIHMRTATPEMSCSALTWSHLHGVTRNPWNLDITPGGSSGGSAAALATGLTALANGSDNGGSVRIPASLCGVVGVKASYGRVPEAAPFNADPYDHQCVMGRSVRDAALFYNAVAGPHVGDPYSDYPLEKIDLDWTNTSVKGKRIAFSADLGFYELAPDVRAVFEEALLKLERAGAVLMPAQIDWDERVIKTAMAHQAQNMAKNLLQDPFTDSQLAQMTPYFRWYVDTAPQYTQQDFIRADAYSDAMRRDMTRVMQTADLLLCPTVCTTDIPNNLDATRDEVIIDGKAVDPIKGWFMTYPFNTLSEFPVISVPAGFARNNVPIGAQIVAGPRNERLAFEAASALEQLVGFFPRSPLPLRRHSSPPKRTTSRLR